MKTVLSISLLALSGLCAMSQDISVAEIRESAKMIPVVSYTPLGFESAVSKAFKFDGATDCFFIKDAGKKAQTVYWFNDFSEKGRFRRQCVYLPSRSRLSLCGIYASEYPLRRLA